MKTTKKAKNTVTILLFLVSYFWKIIDFFFFIL